MGLETMRNLLLTISYDGKRYHGWQIQQNAVAVQEVFQNALQKVLGVLPDIKGCSRTDSGVHAYEYCVSVKTDHAIPCERLVGALNHFLPEDMAVHACREVGEDFPNGGGPEPCPVYTVFPGAVATVLEAGVGADGGPLWAFETAGEDGRLDIVDGMAPLEITPEVTGVLDPETGVYALRFVLREPEE